MSEVSPNNDNGSPAPNPDVRPSVSPRVQGITPAWEPTEHLPLSEPPALETYVVDAARELPPNRGSMADTAERIGSAVGTAQRQVRRGLELVRRLPSSGSAHATHMEQEILDHAASTLHEIGEDVEDMRHQAAQRLDKWSEQAEESFEHLRSEISSALPRLREQARQLADQNPLQTIAAAAAVGFVLGAALRISRRSHRG